MFQLVSYMIRTYGVVVHTQIAKCNAFILSYRFQRYIGLKNSRKNFALLWDFSDRSQILIPVYSGGDDARPTESNLSDITSAFAYTEKKPFRRHFLWIGKSIELIAHGGRKGGGGNGVSVVLVLLPSSPSLPLSLPEFIFVPLYPTLDPYILFHKCYIAFRRFTLFVLQLSFNPLSLGNGFVFWIIVRTCTENWDPHITNLFGQKVSWIHSECALLRWDWKPRRFNYEVRVVWNFNRFPEMCFMLLKFSGTYQIPLPELI